MSDSVFRGLENCNVLLLEKSYVKKLWSNSVDLLTSTASMLQGLTTIRVEFTRNCKTGSLGMLAK